MKRIIAATIGAAMLGGAVVAQEVTFWNRLGSTLVTQPAEKDADADFGFIYDRIQGQYDSEKFSFHGRFQAVLRSEDDWEDSVNLAAPIIEFNGAMRPLPFLELALGNSYGTETPWEGYELPGSYGYGSDVQYGRGYWADGNGGTILFKGAGIGVDGLYVGWNAVPITNALNGGFKRAIGPGERKAMWLGNGWDTQLGIIYNVDGLLGIGVGAKLTTREGGEDPVSGKDFDANQQIGVYVEFTGVENLKVGAGATIDTSSWAGRYVEAFGTTRSFVSSGRGNELDILYDGPLGLGNNLEDPGLTAFVNVGGEYNFAGMGLPITLGADVGLFAGRQTVRVVQEADDITMMPMLVGALLRVDPMENLWFDVRCVYEDSLLEGPEQMGELTNSRLTVTPRVHFLLSEADEFRLQVPITTRWQPEMARNAKYETRSDTGFGIEIFWQHNF